MRGRGIGGRLRAASAAVAGIVLIAGCATSGADGQNDEYVLAFQVTEDRQAFVEDVGPLADWITARTGVPTRVLTVQDDRAQITALAGGQAHAAYMSGGAAWIGWQVFGLEAIAAEVRLADGRTSYTAGLWVLDDSGITTIEDLRGTRSCHTGELTGTGMFVPMGYLLREGYIDPTGLDMDDVAALRGLRERFFSASRIGGGYLGAFQCLSTGQGDVATGRDTAWDDFCGGADPQPWCLDRDAYRFLPEPRGPDPALVEGGITRVPSHPVMVPEGLPPDDRAALQEALLALDHTTEGRRILGDILGARALVAVTAEEHLTPYGDVLQHVPGIEAHFLEEDPG